MEYLAKETREEFENKHRPIIDKIIEVLRENELTLNDAKRVLSIVDSRITKEAKA